MPEIVGWIRNRRDGRVELLVEGPDDQLDMLLSVLNSGPSASQVTRVDTEFSRALGGMKGFDVNYDA
jgi:acylphosphatase